VTLIDSSVWIECWRNAESATALKVRELIINGEACLTGIVLTEILQGARSADEMEYLKSILADIPRVPLDEETFVRAAEITFLLRKKGLRVNTIDTVIAAAGIINHVDVFTLDEHFRLIQKVSPLNLVEV